MKKLMMTGRLFFAIAAIASGLQQLVRQDFVRLVPKSPSANPRAFLWAMASGALLLVAGLAIAADKKRRPGAIVLGALFLAVLLLYLPSVLANPGAGFMWTNPSKTLALLGGAVLLAFLPTNKDASAIDSNERPLGMARLVCTAFLGVFLVICGVQHFVYADFVDQLIPAWIPGHRFWTYFAGVALVAGGVGINVPMTRRLAAVLAGLMIFLWIPLLHIPRALTMRQDPGETSAIFEALAISGIAFLLAAVSRFPTKNRLRTPKTETAAISSTP
jgi:uncharacterized membrane protein